MLVLTQVLSQLVDTGGEDSDLHLGGAGITVVTLVLNDDLSLLILLDHLDSPP